MVDKKPKDSKGRTPLHIAAFHGHFKVCKLFVDNIEFKERNLNLKDFRGWTPLHSAAYNGHERVCLMLIQNVGEKKPKNSEGLTPLEIAEQRKHGGVVAVLKSFDKHNARNEQFLAPSLSLFFSSIPSTKSSLKTFTGQGNFRPPSINRSHSLP